MATRFAELVLTLQSLDVGENEVMTISEASKSLGMSMSALEDLMNRRKDPLRRVIDQAESNPTRATRVLRSDIAAEKARRWARRWDARLA